jgi:hypothetical protein
MNTSREPVKACLTAGCKTMTQKSICGCCQDAATHAGEYPTYRQYNEEGKPIGFTFMRVRTETAQSLIG